MVDWHRGTLAWDRSDGTATDILTGLLLSGEILQSCGKVAELEFWAYACLVSKVPFQVHEDYAVYVGKPPNTLHVTSKTFNMIHLISHEWARLLNWEAVGRKEHKIH